MYGVYARPMQGMRRQCVHPLHTQSPKGFPPRRRFDFVLFLFFNIPAFCFCIVFFFLFLFPFVFIFLLRPLFSISNTSYSLDIRYPRNKNHVKMGILDFQYAFISFCCVSDFLLHIPLIHGTFDNKEIKIT